MKTRPCCLPKTSAALLLLSALPLSLRAELPAHPHGPGWTSWERDGDLGVGVSIHDHTSPFATEAGDSAHQHYINQAFLGPVSQANPSFQPWGVYGVWLDRTAFIDGDSPVTDDAEYALRRVVHGFIDERTEATMPRFKFLDAGMPADAKNRVKEAFTLWGNIAAETSPATGKSLLTGVGFAETTGEQYEIGIRWNAQAGANGGGFVPGYAEGIYGSGTPVEVNFDSSLTWDYTVSAGSSDVSKYHFFSVALHEIGHLLFLEHSPTIDNDLMNGGVGYPIGPNEGNSTWRWDSLVNNPGENDFFAGQKITRQGDNQFLNTAISDLDSVVAVKSLYSIPIPEISPAFVSLGSLFAGMALWQWRRRRTQ